MKRLLAFISFFILGGLQAQEQFVVYFDFDIDETNKQSGKKLSDWIKENPTVTVTKICGYTDSVGEAIYNTDLSDRRAAYVFNKLKDQGFSVSGAEKIGFGETMATGKSAKDRKVIIHYTKPVIVAPQMPKLEKSEFTTTVTTAKKGDKIRIPNLNFYNNSDIILPESRPILVELFQILKDNPLIKIDIQGHICCQKIEENEISLMRALAIYKLLIKNGIDAGRLSYKSFGSSKPIHPLPENNEKEKVANRRVGIEILEK